MKIAENVPNRLINEKSPYLLQHAYNPVDWFPWCGEAFAKAKAENKPVFLSIGYSVCHWCHVMEKESFEDEKVALLLNQSFISIKVDREERPDIDTVYMSVCQALTGQGGWPLTIIMTPEQKPFFAATYIPKQSRYGVKGLMELLPEIAALWKSKKKELSQTGEQIKNFLQESDSKKTPQKAPDFKLIQNCFQTLSEHYDRQNGGFSQAPKFPTPHHLLFLMKYSLLENNDQALQMVIKTLTQMYRGGIFDHIGGGFCRYSTDAHWLVPHFEKMLYDNALLSMVYLEAAEFQNSGKSKFFLEIAERTLSFIQKEMTSPKGGFYCAQDADSEGVEGKYYLFTPIEIQGALGEKRGKEFNTWFDITDVGNFENQNIPNLLHNDQFAITPSSIRKMCLQLDKTRKQRTQLATDDKVLTSWSSLAIVSFSKAYIVTKNSDYLKTAQKAQTMIEKDLTSPDGRLFLRWRFEANGLGQLDDYAFYGWSLLQLYEATFLTHYLEKAIHIAMQMIDLFFDKENGGFFVYAPDQEQLIHRPKDLYDNAMPSGNSVASYLLEKIAAITGTTRWADVRDKQFHYLTGAITYPTAHTFALYSMLSLLYPTQELICTVSKDKTLEQAIDQVRQYTAPNLTVLIKTVENEKELANIAPYTEYFPIPENDFLFFLCQNHACNAPVSKIEQLFS